MDKGLRGFLKGVERYTVIALLLMMVLVIVVSTVQLGIMLVGDLINPPFMLLKITELLSLFGFFFMILIALELVETIRMYLDKNKIHVEVVFLVAMIAVARKVIILDAKTMNPMSLIAVAAMVLALAAGYFLIKRSHRKKSQDQS